MYLFYGVKVFILLSIRILVVYTNLLEKEYVQLISDVHNLYDTSSVLIIHNDKLENVAAIDTTFEIVHRLSTSGILTLTVNITLFLEVQSYYNGQVKRQLYVVFLENYETMKEFEKVMQNAIVSGPAWLLIFRPLKGESLLMNYCMNPRGNPFNVAFNTEMLVKCYNEEVLREWYSMYKNQTMVFDLANWDPVNRLKLLNKKSLYLRRNHIGGISMQVASVNGSSLVKEQFGKLGGFFGTILEELSRSINFRIKHIYKANEYGIWNRTTCEWSGLMKQVYQKNADFAAADMVISKQRYHDVDFTIPLITSRIVLCIREPNITEVQQLGYFQTLDNHIWITIILLIIATPILLTLIKVKSNQSNNWKIILCENYLNTWSIYCQQGLTELPTVTSLKLAYFSIFVSALLVSSAYSAALISYLTVPTTILPFTTLQGFVKNGRYKLIVLKHSVHHETFRITKDHLLRKMKKLMKVESELPKTLLEALGQVCNSSSAFYTTEDTLISRHSSANCKLTWIQTGDFTNLAMPLTKGNQYKGIINFYLNRFLDNGVLNYLSNRRQQIKNENLKTEYHTVTLSGVAPILKIVIVGIMLSVLLLTAEKVYYVYNEKYSRGAQNNLANASK